MPRRKKPSIAECSTPFLKNLLEAFAAGTFRETEHLSAELIRKELRKRGELIS